MTTTRRKKIIQICESELDFLIKSIENRILYKINKTNELIKKKIFFKLIFIFEIKRKMSKEFLQKYVVASRECTLLVIVPTLTFFINKKMNHCLAAHYSVVAVFFFCTD